MPAAGTRADVLKLEFLQEGPVPTPTPLRTIPGVTILGASHRNGAGKGLLRAEMDGRLISWRAPGSQTFGNPIIAEADGAHIVEDGEDVGKYLQIEVTTAHLRPGPIEQAVYIQDRWNLMLPDLTAEEAAAGTTFVVSDVQLHNVGAGTLVNIRGWIEPGNATLSISGGGAYSSPTTEETSLELGSLGPGATRAFAVKRIVAPGAGADPKVLAGLHFRFDGV